MIYVQKLEYLIRNKMEKEKVITIDFGQHVRAVLVIKENKIISIDAIDGWGNQIHPNEIQYIHNDLN